MGIVTKTQKSLSPHPFPDFSSAVASAISFCFVVFDCEGLLGATKVGHCVWRRDIGGADDRFGDGEGKGEGLGFENGSEGSRFLERGEERDAHCEVSFRGPDDGDEEVGWGSKLRERRS
jgi:hypothetical protein